MPHIHTGEGEHDHTVSAYVTRFDLVEPAVLLHHHKTLGRYLQFGGHIELRENPWEAITHELREESGYDLDQLRLLQPPVRITSLSTGDLHPTPLCYNTHRIGEHHYHSDTSWAFVTTEVARHAVGADESRDLRWFAASELAARTRSESDVTPRAGAHRPDSDVDASTRDICRFIFEVCRDWDQIPAATWASSH